MMKKCPNCGKEYPDTAKFCAVCGRELQVQMAAPEKQQRRMVVCVHCGREIEQGRKFCAYCGHSTAPKSDPSDNSAAPGRNAASGRAAAAGGNTASGRGMSSGRAAASGSQKTPAGKRKQKAPAGKKVRRQAPPRKAKKKNILPIIIAVILIILALVFLGGFLLWQYPDVLPQINPFGEGGALEYLVDRDSADDKEDEDKEDAEDAEDAEDDESDEADESEEEEAEEYSCTIKFVADGGSFKSGDENIVTYEYDSSESEELTVTGEYQIPEREDAKFAYWESADGEQFPEDEKFEELAELRREDLDLFAVWEAEICFDANGGLFEDGTDKLELTALLEEEVEVPQDPEQEGGLWFSGWNTAEDGSGDALETEEPLVSEGNVTYYAVWEEPFKEKYIPYTGSPAAFKVPVDGTYQITLAGASGGGDGGTPNGGTGGLLTVQVELKKTDSVQFTVGQGGFNDKIGQDYPGGYNGGGTAYWSGSGGGRTDVKINGTLAAAAAGGGGGTSTIPGGAARSSGTSASHVNTSWQGQQAGDAGGGGAGYAYGGAAGITEGTSGACGGYGGINGYNPNVCRLISESNISKQSAVSVNNACGVQGWHGDSTDGGGTNGYAYIKLIKAADAE